MLAHGLLQMYNGTSKKLAALVAANSAGQRPRRQILECY